MAPLDFIIQRLKMMYLLPTMVTWLEDKQEEGINVLFPSIAFILLAGGQLLIVFPCLQVMYWLLGTN